MNRKQLLVIILLASFAGFIGGLLSNQIFEIRSAFAVKEPEPTKVVIAQEFRVVDADGKIVGSFGASGDLPELFSQKKMSHIPAPQLSLGHKKGFQIILSASDAEGSRIVMKDKRNKTRTVIGNTDLYIPLTRVTHNRQVSSIVLFDQYGRFLWSAPGGVRTELGR